MGIVFNKGGLFTTVQDYGRMGYQNLGFHVCGVMDRHAYWVANLLVDNTDREAVIEFTICGPTLYFTSDTVICITGGDYDPKINGEKIPMYQAVEVHKGDELEMGFCKTGTWGYIAFAGGLDVPVVMGSRSTDIKCKLGGYEGRPIRDGDEIDFLSNVKSLPLMKERKLETPEYGAEVVELRVTMGPQDDHFTQEGLGTFLDSEYTVTSQCDRMGYRLEGPVIEHNELGADIISDGIAKGAIQVPNSGQPIIMMSDRQTLGGYTKIANVISVDIPKLAQCKYPQKIRFSQVSVEEAQRIYMMERERMMLLNERFIKKSLRHRLFNHWKK
ncbi:MAG: biotin-dependent carboxyltransferase family protein [Lachnospiraceae bacterium]|nr:biotin-dependent carboxyltransferase family protein [Lachnospiraceae bacterium]